MKLACKFYDSSFQAMTRLVEAMIQTPNKLKINKGMTKSIIRNMLAKKFDINTSETKKLYVSDPQREWIKKDCKNEILEILKDGYLEKSTRNRSMKPARQ